MLTKPELVGLHYDLTVQNFQFKFRQRKLSGIYNNICVCFGAFHMQMEYFAAIGTFLTDSGGPQGVY